MPTNNTKQAIWVAVGSLCSFGFTIVSSMILSRYFAKADYGTYKQVMYVYNTLLTIFTLGLPKAFSYFLPRVELSQAKSLIRKITNLFFLLGGVFSLLLFLLASQIAGFLKNPDLKDALRIFAVTPFLLLPTMGLEGILATFRKTMFLAFYNVSTNVFKLLCVSLPVMIWHLDYQKALMGFVVASFITFIIALILKYYPVQQEGNDPCDVTYKSIFKFSLPLLTASLWGILIHSADQFFISRYYGNKVFAEFSNAAIPLPFIGMVTGSCATVLSPIFARMHHQNSNFKNDLLPLWNSLCTKSALLIYPLIMFCLIFGDILMIALYGSSYKNSTQYFRIKIFSDFFTIIMFAPLIINIGKVKFYSRVHMLNAIFVIVFEYISVKTIKSPLAISYISAIGQIFKMFLLANCVAKYFDMKIYNFFPLVLMIKIIIPSLLILLIEHYVIVDMLLLNPWASVFIGFILYIIIFWGYSLVSKLDYWSIIKPLLIKHI